MQTFYFLLWFLMKISSRKIYTNIVDEFTTFKNDSVELKVKKSFPENTKQYTIFGWYQHTGNEPGLYNIFELQNLKQTKSSSSINYEYDPEHPPCLYTQIQFQLDPSLLNDSKIIDNPNCFPKIQTLTYQQKESPLIFLNYDLDKENNLYSLELLISQGQDENKKSILLLESFDKNLFKENQWFYFALSIDYENNKVQFYQEIYDIEDPHSRTKEIVLVKNSLILDQNFLFSINSIGENDYFNEVLSLQGNLYNLAITNFITNEQLYFSLGIVSNKVLLYDGVLIDIIGNVYKEKEPLKSSGLIKGEYIVNGKHDIIFTENHQKVGVRFYEAPFSFINLGLLQIPQELQISLSFYFKISFKEPLSDTFKLINYGEDGKSGFIEINLNKKDSGRSLSFRIIGTGDILLWESPFELQQETMLEISIGFVISAARTFNIIYIDSESNQMIRALSNRFFYDFKKQNMVVFGNPQIKQEGSLIFERFILFNNVSHIISQFQKIESEKCKVFYSGYEQNSCLQCQNSIANKKRECIDYCPLNYKNPMLNICVNCLKDNCQEYPKTKLLVSQEDDDTFILTSTRPLLFNLTDHMKQLFDVSVDKFDSSSEFFDYTVYNITSQQLGFDFIFHKDVSDKNLIIQPKEEYISQIYDINHNLIERKVSQVPLKNICYVGSSKQLFFDFLFYILFGLLILGFLVLLVLSIKNQEFNKWFFWKYWLQNYLKYQLIAVFTLLSVRLPCCVYHFFDKFYNYFIQWNYVLRSSIDNTYQNNQIYRDILIIKSPDRRQFLLEGVRPFILHNNGLFFIFHITIFTLWLINFTISKCVSNLKIKNLCNKIDKIFLYTIFCTVLFLSFFPTLIFSAVNLRQIQFSHFYFIISFIISLLYIFWLIFYFYISIFETINYQNLSKKITQKYYLFLVSYKKEKFSYNWDLIQNSIFTIIAFSIGFIYENLIVQSVINIISLLMILVLIYLFKPFINTIQLKSEIVNFALFILAYVFLFIISINEENGCTFCGNREGAFCFLIVIPIFLGLLINQIIFFYLLIDDLIYEKEITCDEFTNPWERISVQKLQAKSQLEKSQQFESQYTPKHPHIETETQGSLIFTDRNEDLKEIERLKLKQEKIDQFLQKEKSNFQNIQTLNSNDLESEVFKEELHDLNESIEIIEQNHNKI